MLQVKQFWCAGNFGLIIFKSGGKSLQVDSCFEPALATLSGPKCPHPGGLSAAETLIVLSLTVLFLKLSQLEHLYFIPNPIVWRLVHWLRLNDS